MKVIGGKWKPPIIFNLGNKTYRFGKLRRALQRITQQMLSKQLGELVGNKMIAPKVYAEMPPRVEYSLAAKGKSIIPVMESVQGSQLATYGYESPLDSIMNLNLD